MSTIFKPTRIINNQTFTDLSTGNVLFANSSTVSSSSAITWDSSTNSFRSTGGVEAIGSFTNSSNYKRLRLFTDANYSTVLADSAGTGGANSSLKLKGTGTGGVIVASPANTDALIITSEGSGYVTPPSIVFARSTSNTSNTFRVRINCDTVAGGGSDFDGLSVRTPSGHCIALGTSEYVRYANGQCYSSNDNNLSVLGNIYTQTALIVGQDTDGAANALGGVVRSGAKRLSTTNVTGSNLTIQAGNGTGNAATPSILFQTPTVQASGTSFQPQATRLEISSTSINASLPIRLNVLTTSQINAIASPSAGMTVYNSTNNAICFYNGSSWQQVTSSTMV